MRTAGWGFRRRVLEATARRVGTGSTLVLATLLAMTPVGAQERPIELDTLEVQVGSRVSAGLPVLTRSIQLLGREEIARLPVRTLSDLLEWATGVEISARSPAQSDLSLRGAGFEQVVVMVNGVRMSDPQTGHFDLDLAVPLDAVERVEVLRGPASALYGADAVGGVVNIVTKAAPAGVGARVEGGSWGSARIGIHGGRSWGEGAWLGGGGEWTRSDGHREGTDFDMSVAHLGGSHPLAGGRLRLEAGMARRDFGAQGFYAPYPSFEKTRTYTSSVRWADSGQPAPTMEAGASYRRHQDEFILLRDDPDVYRNRHTSTQFGGDLLVRTRLGEDLGIALGAEGYLDRIRSNALGDHDEGRAAAYGEASLGGGPAVLSAGLRLDWHERFGSVLSPSLSGSVRLGGNVRLRGAAGGSYRAPTWTERYYHDPANQGRPDLKPERAWSGEAGVDFFFASRQRVSLTGFVRRAERMIDWAKPSGAPAEEPWQTRNVDRATFRGVEADLFWDAPGGFQVAAGGSLLGLDAASAAGYESKYALRPLRQRLTLGITRALARGIAVSVNGMRGKRAGEEAFHKVDLRATLPVLGSRIYVDVRNLFEAKYPDITGERAPGRAFFFGLEMGGPR